MKLQRPFAFAIPTQLTFTTFVFQTLFVYGHSSFVDHATVTPVFTMTLFSIILIFFATFNTFLHVYM